MPEQTSAGSGSFLQYLAGNLRRNGRSPVRVYTGFVIAHGTDTFSSTDYARAGWVSVCIAIAYGLLVMAPWYALWGMPVWDASAPWPF